MFATEGNCRGLSIHLPCRENRCDYRVGNKHINTCGESFLSRGSRRFRDPDSVAYLICSRNSKEADVFGARERKMR